MNAVPEAKIDRPNLDLPFQLHLKHRKVPITFCILSAQMTFCHSTSTIINDRIHPNPTRRPPQNLATVTPAQPSPEGPPAATATPSHVQAQVQAQIQAVKDQQHTGATPDDGVIPPVFLLDRRLRGRSILELDLNAMADKPWRRPGSDISDWFNYGFDELSWEAYCYRRRDLGEMANVLKTNVIVRALSAICHFYLCHPFIIPSFLAMCIELRSDARGTTNRPTADVRTMVMTGANAMMNSAGANPNMMGANVMMDMGMMGPMGMGMGNEMGAHMGNPMMQGMMADGGQGQQGVGPGTGTPEQVNGVGMMQEGFNPNAGGGMMNMGMGGEYGMQEQNTMVQQIYPVMEPPNVPTAPGGRGGTPVPFRGGRGVAGPIRGRGFQGRGRGRGGMYGGDVPPPAPVRPASPLPPGVPTGPRNQNKYKDRDGNAPAVDGLDYGGGKEGMGRRTPSGEPEERISSRKRRISPGWTIFEVQTTLI
ncbi:hypothetical protein BJ912DRAFT_1090676 [Pholiota molesta]|nr:hypothetical protein BJ912DRAFT_1090676 [Pholiota molesta]